MSSSNKACRSLFRDVIEVLVESKHIKFHDSLGDFFPLVANKPMVVTDYLDTLQAKGNDIEANKKGKGKAYIDPPLNTMISNKEYYVIANEIGSLGEDGDVCVVVVVQKERDVALAFGDATIEATLASDKARVEK